MTGTTGPASYRIIPFALFMGFIGVGESLRWLEKIGFVSLESTVYLYLYPIKTFVVLLSSCISGDTTARYPWLISASPVIP